jgi:hypothetical protein
MRGDDMIRAWPDVQFDPKSDRSRTARLSAFPRTKFPLSIPTRASFFDAAFAAEGKKPIRLGAPTPRYPPVYLWLQTRPKGLIES